MINVNAIIPLVPGDSSNHIGLNFQHRCFKGLRRFALNRPVALAANPWLAPNNFASAICCRLAKTDYEGTSDLYNNNPLPQDSSLRPATILPFKAKASSAQVLNPKTIQKQSAGLRARGRLRQAFGA